MEKLDFWKKNEPLYHDKLNNEVKIVNDIIEKLEDEKGNFSGGMSSVTYPQIEAFKHDILEQWKHDGHGVVLSGYTKGFIGEAGLYARDAGFAISDKLRYVPSNHSLKKIANYECLTNDGVLYQEIKLADDGQTVVSSCLKYSQFPITANNSPNTIIRILSRTGYDCTYSDCGKTRPFTAFDAHEAFFNLDNYSGGGGGGEVIINETIKGLYVECCQYKTWEELKEPHTILSYFDNSMSKITITAQNKNGFLHLLRFCSPSTC